MASDGLSPAPGVTALPGASGAVAPVRGRTGEAGGKGCSGYLRSRISCQGLCRGYGPSLASFNRYGTRALYGLWDAGSRLLGHMGTGNMVGIFKRDRTRPPPQKIRRGHQPERGRCSRRSRRNRAAPSCRSGSRGPSFCKIDPGGAGPGEKKRRVTTRPAPGNSTR